MLENKHVLKMYFVFISKTNQKNIMTTKQQQQKYLQKVCSNNTVKNISINENTTQSILLKIVKLIMTILITSIHEFPKVLKEIEHSSHTFLLASLSFHCQVETVPSRSGNWR